MKRTLTTLALMTASVLACAHPVDAGRAQAVAQGFWDATLHGKKGLLADARTAAWAYPGIYHFAHPDGGFVLVAADDAARPILGYSASGSLVADQMPVQLRNWLDTYQQQLDWTARHHGKAYAADSLAWLLLEQGLPLKDGDGVEPLLTTRWDQYTPYNDLCPAGTVSGCAATAQAQLMKYWNHPSFGIGSHSYTHYIYGLQQADFQHTLYDWAHMEDSPTRASGSRERLAVATLMYHCGVSLEMGYNTAANGGSAALGLIGMPGYASIDNSLQDHFGYSRQMEVIIRDAGYTNDQWRSMLTAELDLGHPILYTGSSEQGGHAFICDGYDGRGNLHFNFGWSGIGDGYYPVDSISPGVGGAGGNVTYTFNLGNSALLGAVPAHRLRVSDTLFNFGREGGRDSLLVEINKQVDAYVSVASSAAWLTVDDTSSQWVRLQVAPITDGTPERSATLTFRQGTETVVVRVAQAGYNDEDLCPLTVVMEATRGDGWQGGAHLTLESAGGYIFGTARLEQGTRDSAVIRVPQGEVYSVWHSGGGTDRYINYYVRNQYGENVVEAEYASRTGGTHLIGQPCEHVGIGEAVPSSESLNAYPNPTSGLLHIGTGEPMKAELLDLTGRRLAETTGNTMDISHLPTGTYLLRITTEKSHSTQRIVKL